MKKIVIPFNTDADGNARCIKAGYYKMGFANFVMHPKDGFTATSIIEVEEDEQENQDKTHQRD